MNLAGDGKNRTKPSTAVYRALMVEFERQRLDRNLSMAEVDDLAGTQDGYNSRMLYPDTPYGRQAQWTTVQDVGDALFGRGFSIQIIASDAVGVSAVTLDKGASTNALKSRHWRHSKHFSELGRLGGLARAKNLSKSKIQAIGKKGARAWKAMRKAERKAAEHHATNAAK